MSDRQICSRLRLTFQLAVWHKLYQPLAWCATVG